MNHDENPPSHFSSKDEEWIIMTFVIWIEFLFVFFVSQKLELNIIYCICFDNSMKKVIQWACVDFCENVRSQDMYVKCPKIVIFTFI